MNTNKYQNKKTIPKTSLLVYFSRNNDKNPFKSPHQSSSVLISSHHSNSGHAYKIPYHLLRVANFCTRELL